MGGPEELERLRLWQRAYGDEQPDERRRLGMGAALARYFKALALRRSADRNGIGDDAIGSSGPVDPIERI